MEPEILFSEILLFGSKSIAPLRISKSHKRRLKKKDKLRSLKKEAGFEGAVKTSSDRPSIPSLQDLQGQKSIALPPPESAGFDDSGDGMVSVDGRTTASMDEVRAEAVPYTEKKRRLPATFNSDLCKGRQYCL